MSTGTIIAAAMLTVLIAALLSMCALIDEEKDRRGRELSQQNTWTAPWASTAWTSTTGSYACAARNE